MQTTSYLGDSNNYITLKMYNLLQIKWAFNYLADCGRYEHVLAVVCGGVHMHTQIHIREYIPAGCRCLNNVTNVIHRKGKRNGIININTTIINDS